MRLQEILLFVALVFSQGAFHPAFADTPNDSPAAEKTPVPIEESNSQSDSLSKEDEQKQKNERLIRAIEKKYLKAVKLLLEEGADPNATDGEGSPWEARFRAALMIAIGAESPKIVDLLLEAGAGKDTSDWQLMFDTIYSQPLNLKIIQMLISNRGIGYHTADMDIILSAAIKRENPKVVEMLLEAGINFKKSAEKVLGEAVETGNIKIMKLILDKIVFKRENQSKFQSFKFQMKHLLKKKVDGRSVLVRAVELGNREAVRLLLDRGVSSDIMVESESLRDYAKRKKFTKIAKLLGGKSSALPGACSAAFNGSK